MISQPPIFDLNSCFIAIAVWLFGRINAFVFLKHHYLTLLFCFVAIRVLLFGRVDILWSQSPFLVMFLLFYCNWSVIVWKNGRFGISDPSIFDLDYPVLLQLDCYYWNLCYLWTTNFWSWLFFIAIGCCYLEEWISQTPFLFLILLFYFSRSVVVWKSGPFVKFQPSIFDLDSSVLLQLECCYLEEWTVYDLSTTTFYFYFNAPFLLQLECCCLEKWTVCHLSTITFWS